MDMDVGEIDRIKIWHDNSGAGPAWYLESVVIRKKHSAYRQVTDIFVERLAHASKALYLQACGHLQKINKSRASSAKENDRSSSHSRDYDDSGSNRGILRSPIPNDKTSSQKKVRWDEHHMGSQDRSMSIDTKRMKTMQKDDLSQQVESGHFDHHAHWISTHNYAHKKWQIQSIEEQNSLNLDGSIRSALLQDRTVSSSKIKSTVNERDDDLYEFDANRWLSKDEGDRKLEVYLTPKSTKLSSQTITEAKSKHSLDKIIDFKKKHPASEDFRYEKHEREHPERLTKSDLGSLSRSPRETTKTHFDDPRSSSPSSKRQDESLLDKYHRPASRSSKEQFTPGAGGKDLASLLADQSFHDKYYKEQPGRSSQRSQPGSSSPSSRRQDEHHRPSAAGRDSPNMFFNQNFHEKYQREYTTQSPKLDLGKLDRSPRDTSKTHFDDPRSSQRSQQGVSNPSPKRHDESAMDKFHRTATSPMVSHRDSTSKPPTDPSYRPKSAARPNPELSSTRPTRSKFNLSLHSILIPFSLFQIKYTVLLMVLFL